MATIPKLNSLWSSTSFFLSKASQAADKQGFTLVQISNNDDGVVLGCGVEDCEFRLELRPFKIGKFRVEEACHTHFHEVLYPVTSTSSVPITRSRTIKPPSIDVTISPDEPFRFPPPENDFPTSFIPLNIPPWDYPMIPSNLKAGTSSKPVSSLAPSNTPVNPGLSRSSSATVTIPDSQRLQGTSSFIRRTGSAPPSKALLSRPLTSPAVPSSMRSQPVRSVSGRSETASVRWADLDATPALSASSSQSATPTDVPTTPVKYQSSRSRDGNDKPSSQAHQPSLSVSIPPFDEQDFIATASIGESGDQQFPDDISLPYDQPNEIHHAISSSQMPISNRRSPSPVRSDLKSQPIKEFLLSALPGRRLLVHEQTFRDAGVTTVLPLLTLDDEECREFLKNDLEPPIEKLDMRLIVTAIRKLRKSLNNTAEKDWASSRGGSGSD